MGRKSAVGVANGNWRAGDYYWYAQAVKRGWNNQETEQAMNKKKTRAMYWNQRLANAFGILRSVDPNNCQAWFDDDTNVPADANDQQMSVIIETRVRSLIGHYPTLKARSCRGIFIWSDEFNGVYVYSKEVGKKTLYALEFANMAEAESFIFGLPFSSCGYGVVLDILPANALTMISKEA